MNLRLSHITLLVLDQDVALKFYQNLGFEVHTDAMMPDGFRWLTVSLPNQSDLEIALIPAVTQEQRELVGNQADEMPFLALSTTDCKKTYQEWRRHSVEVLQEPTERSYGMEALFADLYGNVLCVVEPKK